MSEHKVLPYLTEVMIKHCNLPGLIKAVWIEGNNIQYKVSYFNNGAHTEAWLMEEEFTTQVNKAKIGF